MKKLFLLFTLFVALISASGFKTYTIKEIKDRAKDKENVVVEGMLIKYLDTDEFILKDRFSEIEIEIDEHLWQRINESQPLLNTTLKFTVIVDKELLDEIELKAVHIEK